jgi:hypothetical protein
MMQPMQLMAGRCLKGSLAVVAVDEKSQNKKYAWGRKRLGQSGRFKRFQAHGGAGFSGFYSADSALVAASRCRDFSLQMRGYARYFHAAAPGRAAINTRVSRDGSRGRQSTP